ncbi:hypothetical protein PCG10_006279 [Penicillium crustosum]|uniref:Zn(2)-C6 fungal-type domain-containing protein n=1 Tax=Penicillium crustosum TaxID=36656 RepID=A0A9P5GLR9_PENCR|nr:hypothetical protein PCG10_006279 [Penicillium crustosum]
MTGAWHRFRVEKPHRTSPALTYEVPPHQASVSVVTATNACLRCKRTKKKCDRSLPECLLCRKAGAGCSFPTEAARTTAQSALRARVQWLSAFVDSLLPPNTASISTLDTGADLYEATGLSVHAQTDSRIPLVPPNEDGVDCTREEHTFNNTHTDHHTMTSSSVGDLCSPVLSNSLSLAPAQSPIANNCARFPPLGNVSPGIDGLRLIRSYFDTTHLSYPFLDPVKVSSEAEKGVGFFYFGGGVDITPASTRLYLIMMIGCERLWRSGMVSDEVFNRFQVPRQEIVQMCLSSPCIESAENLLLLTICALFDPHPDPLWMLAGILGRLAVSLGLNRRQEIPGMSLLEVESRHRLFWSIFSIDNLISIICGLPLAIQEVDSNLPLPGVTTEEFAAPGQADHITTLQVARQAITLRQLEGKCLQAVHLRKTLLPSYRERRATITELRAAAENWYTQGCFLARRELHEVHFHNSVSWLNVNYHGILILLYCPSFFNSHLTPNDLNDLRHAVRKYVQSAHVQFQDRDLALNHTTLSKMLVICRILLHCYFRCEGTASFLDEQQATVLQCIGILEAFPTRWLIAKRSCTVYKRFSIILQRQRSHFTNELAENTQSAVFGPFPFPAHSKLAAIARCPTDDSVQNIASEQTETNIHVVCDDTELLLQEVLGVSSIYNYFSGEPRTWPEQ